MKRILSATLAVIVALGLAGAVRAQSGDVPAEVRKALWCGLALLMVTSEAPADSTEEQKPLVDALAAGGERLVGAAREGYLGHGYTESGFAAQLDRTMAEVVRQSNMIEGKPEFSFEVCAALLRS